MRHYNIVSGLSRNVSRYIVRVVATNELYFALSTHSWGTFYIDSGLGRVMSIGPGDISKCEVHRDVKSIRVLELTLSWCWVFFCQHTEKPRLTRTRRVSHPAPMHRCIRKHRWGTNGCSCISVPGDTSRRLTQLSPAQIADQKNEEQTEWLLY